MKKVKNKKQNKINNFMDNKKVLNQLIQKTYRAILQLDTKTLSMVSFDVYKELISRDDYNSLNDEIIKFQILCDDLKEKGVDITCLI